MTDFIRIILRVDAFAPIISGSRVNDFFRHQYHCLSIHYVKQLNLKKHEWGKEQYILYNIS